MFIIHQELIAWENRQTLGQFKFLNAGDVLADKNRVPPLRPVETVIISTTTEALVGGQLTRFNIDRFDETGLRGHILNLSQEWAKENGVSVKQVAGTISADDSTELREVQENLLRHKSLDKALNFDPDAALRRNLQAMPTIRPLLSDFPLLDAEAVDFGKVTTADGSEHVVPTIINFTLR